MFSYVNSRVRAFVSVPEKKTLFENFISLSALQGVNYILPLITVPYLVRVLGPEKFGLIVFAQAFVKLFATFTDYGFNFSATRKISIYRENNERVSEIFSSVIFIKSGFMFISFVALLGLVFAIPKFDTDWIVYLFAFGMVIGNVLFPVWFFQGMERMKYITFLNLLARGIFTVAIFVFIRKQADYLYVPLISSLGFITAGILSLWIVWKGFNIQLRVPFSTSVIEALKDGWHIFISTITASIYTTAIPFILGVLTNYKIVGYYSAGEKIIRALEGMLSPLSQAVYPYVGNVASKSRVRAIIFVRTLAKIVGPVTFLLSLAIIFFASQISNIILGNQFSQSIPVIRILAFSLVAKGLGHIFLLQTMLNFGHDRAVFRVVLLASLVSIASSFVLMPFFLHKGAAIAALLPEVTVLLLSAMFVERRYSIFGFTSCDSIIRNNDDRKDIN